MQMLTVSFATSTSRRVRASSVHWTRQTSRRSVSKTLHVSSYRDLAVYITAHSACLCSLFSKYTCYKYMYHNHDQMLNF